MGSGFFELIMFSNVGATNRPEELDSAVRRRLVCCLVLFLKPLAVVNGMSRLSMWQEALTLLNILDLIYECLGHVLDSFFLYASLLNKSFPG